MTQYFAFAAVSLMIALSPGPSWVYVVTSSLAQGKKGGLSAAAGNSTGILCHALLAVLGLSALVAYSAVAYNVVRISGACYLVFLGVKILLYGGITSRVNREGDQRTALAVFRGGMLVNLLNPKMAILMLSLLPQFVSPGASHPALQIAILGSMHAVIAGIVHTHVALFSDTISRRFSSTFRLQRIIRSITGLLFIFFGVKLALT